MGIGFLYALQGNDQTAYEDLRSLGDLLDLDANNDALLHICKTGNKLVIDYLMQITLTFLENNFLVDLVDTLSSAASINLSQTKKNMGMLLQKYKFTRKL